MAGHSKWSKIKRKKGALDQKKGKILTRHTHEIMVAVRDGGGGDPDLNAKLRLAIERAKASNMPNNNIERAIKRATGEDKGAAEMLEITYEGYGPGGSAVLVEVLTDNKNRSVSSVRHAFSKCNGSLGESGCVSWKFKKKGVIEILKDQIAEEALMELALEAGADDVADSDEVWEVVCDPAVFNSVEAKLGESLKLELAEVQMLPDTRIDLAGKEAEQMMRLIDMLEDLDDVLNVYADCDFPEGEVPE